MKITWTIYDNGKTDYNKILEWNERTTGLNLEQGWLN